PACNSTCDTTPFVPLCDADKASTALEEACLTCRLENDADYYNLKDGACINNVEYGYLAGIAFTIMFAFVGLFAGWLCDVMDLRLLHTGAVLVWSLAAAAHGTCSSFQCLLIARILVGFGEAFNAPACYALISAYFPHTERATANGIYSTGTYLGSAVSSLCLSLAGAIGWRDTSFLSGSFGITMAIILFYTIDSSPKLTPLPPTPTATTLCRLSRGVPSPLKAEGEAAYHHLLPLESSKGQADEGTKRKKGSGERGGGRSGFEGCPERHKRLELMQSLQVVLRNPLILQLLAATSLRMVGVWTMASYLAVYYHRAFPSNTSLFAVINAVLVSLGGMASSYGGGAIADRFLPDFPGVLGWLPAIGALAAIFPVWVVLFSESFELSVLSLLFEYLVAECWLGPCMAVLQREVPMEVAGVSVAILLWFNTSLGQVGPLLVAYFDDGTANIRVPFFLALLLSYCTSAVFLTLVGCRVQLKARKGT
ncbi:unnamed protein product, partial [Discosporangium mesarthrocarpum]